MLPRAVATARRALRVVRQNLGWALAYNLAAVPAAALGLVSPWLAALGMSLSSLGVVLNARRLATPETSHEHFLSLVLLGLGVFALAVWALFWAIDDGQYDDLEQHADSPSRKKIGTSLIC